MKLLREEELKAKTVMEVDALKNKFFTNISHEFRTPLTIINGITEVAKNKITSLDAAGLHQSFQKIKGQSDKLLNLVNQVLGLTRLETKSIHLNNQQISLNGWLKMIIDELNEYAIQKGIDLNFSSDLEEGVVEVDDQQLKTILTNLISNALKFTHEGGTIEILARPQISEEKNGIAISVKDSGIGIKEQDLSRIFERYYKVEDQYGINQSGMGVGLAMCKELVHLMEGEIHVTSKWNSGTVFTVWLPLILKKADNISPIPHATREDQIDLSLIDIGVGNGNPSLLVIDDQPEILELLEEMLSDGFSVLKARNGKEGLEKALEFIPDIIIADIMMPEMDGYQLCNEIKSNQRTDHIPVVLLTAKTETHDRIQGYQKGADAYVTKPFEKQELLILIRNLYALRKTLQEKYSKFSFVEEQVKVKNEDSFIHQVHQILEENISNPSLSVEEMAKQLFMSRMQLHRKMKAIADRSASHYIRSYRLHKSKLLLKDFNLSISNVGYDVGFQSPNYFSRSFHQEFGMTPSDYRDSLA